MAAETIEVGGNILVALFLLFFAKCISYKDEIYRVVKIFILVQVYSSLFLKDCTRYRLGKFLIAPLPYKKNLSCRSLFRNKPYQSTR